MLRSIDMQQIFLQSDKVERVQQTHINSSECRQRQFETELAKEKRELRAKTKDLEASGKLKVKEEKMQDQRKQNKKKTRDEQAGDDDTVAELSAVEPGSKVDIRV